MKTIKQTLFVTSAALAAGILAALCSGCDGSGGDGEASAGDAGASDLVKSDVVKTDATRSDALPGTCVVPASARHIPGTDHPPTAGYKTLSGIYLAVPCSVPQSPDGPSPTDCSLPVDGFTKASDTTKMFCCVATLGAATGSSRVSFSSLKCDPGPSYTSNSPTTAIFSAGRVALCTEDGVFAGWECRVQGS